MNETGIFDKGGVTRDIYGIGEKVRSRAERGRGGTRRNWRKKWG